jgi:pimeloyl-ACP methyl ester carboxylesterase
VHGAWHGGWAWGFVANKLQGKGHVVYTPDLPGHGINKQPFENITMDAYVNAISTLVSKQGKPVILVGHSMSGAVTLAKLQNACLIRSINLCSSVPFCYRMGKVVLDVMDADHAPFVSREQVLSKILYNLKPQLKIKKLTIVPTRMAKRVVRYRLLCIWPPVTRGVSTI